MIRITGITKSFEQLQVLKGIDLEIGQGEIVSIVGPSGAGKTTLLQIMGSLDRPDSGTVSYDGTDLFSLSDRKLAQFRNRNIGFVFQFHQLLPEFTMEENVAMPALISGTSRRTAMERARKLIDYLGLPQSQAIAAIRGRETASRRGTRAGQRTQSRVGRRAVGESRQPQPRRAPQTLLRSAPRLRPDIRDCDP